MYARKTRFDSNLIALFMLMVTTSCLAQSEPDSSNMAFPALQGPYLGQKPPGMTPEIFAPGSVSTAANEHGCTFSPDGEEFYFTRILDGRPTIMLTRRMEERWTLPEVASFSGRYNDRLPHVSPDGQKLFFGSVRPWPDSTGPVMVRVWVVNRLGPDWGKAEAVDLGLPGRLMDASVSINGSLYTSGILKRCLVNGQYVNCDDSLLTLEGTYPYVAPDENYILFCLGALRNIAVSYRRPDCTWTNARQITHEQDSYRIQGFPEVSPDGKYLFFTADHDIYWVDAGVIEEHRPK